MIDEEEVLDFLEHYGIRGMHWGIRNERTKSGKKNNRARNRKIAIGVGVGAAATGIILAKSRGVKISSLHISPSTLRQTQTIIDSNKSTPIKKIPRISPETQAFIRDFKSKQHLINEGANSDLKKLYSMNETPIRLREYLPT